MLPGDTAQVLDPADMPSLADKLGHDLVTSDGTTLLGADDKAGVAIIVTAARRLLEEDGPRATARIAFTVDEEVGHGTDHFDLAAFGADWHTRSTAPGSGRSRRKPSPRTSSSSRSSASASIPGRRRDGW